MITITEIKDSGFRYEPEQPQDYIMGVTSPLPAPPVIFPNGHGWTKYRAKAEMQFNKHFDTFSCTIYSILKATVAYLHKVYGVETTMSEMYHAFFAGVSIEKGGTTARQALESLRLNGWVPDSEYPFTAETTSEQFFLKPPETIILQGKDKLTKWKVHWEQLDVSGNVPHSKIKEALKRTEVLCSGYAWAERGGEFIDLGKRANHMFKIDDYRGDNLIVYDSYPFDRQYDQDSEDVEFEKVLASSYRIWSAHRVWLTPIVTVKKTNTTKILKDKDSSTIFFADPVLSEGAFESYAANHGKEVPKDKEGKLDWDRIEIDGEVELKK